MPMSTKSYQEARDTQDHNRYLSSLIIRAHNAVPRWELAEDGTDKGIQLPANPIVRNEVENLFCKGDYADIPGGRKLVKQIKAGTIA